MKDHQNFYSVQEKTYSFEPIIGNDKDSRTFKGFTDNYQNVERSL